MASKQSPARNGLSLPLAFALVAGLFFFVTIIKIGNPVILDDAVAPPATASEIYYESWPAKWGIWMALPVAAAGLLAIPWKQLKFRWVLGLPALWLAWEFIAASQTAGPDLTRATMMHFVVCVALFYLGYFALQDGAPTWPIWTGISLALCWVIHAGLQQHFGGLEATRAMFQSGHNPTDLPPRSAQQPGLCQTPRKQPDLCNVRLCQCAGWRPGADIAADSGLPVAIDAKGSTRYANYARGDSRGGRPRLSVLVRFQGWLAGCIDDRIGGFGALSHAAQVEVGAHLWSTGSWGGRFRREVFELLSQGTE